MHYRDRQGATAFLRERGVPVDGDGLKDLAYKKRGPKYSIINGRALYTDADLLAWIAEQSARPLPKRTRRDDSTAAA